MSNLSSSELKQLTLILTSLLEELKTQYDRGKPATDIVVLDQSKVGRLSRMDAMQQQKIAESTIKSTESRLRKVTMALNKINDGDFGACDECGLPIALARLKIQPEAPFCIQCQTILES